MRINMTAALLLCFIGVTIAAECYSKGMKWGDIVDGDIKDAIKDFCIDHHGATFTEGGQAKGCVDTSKGQNTRSLNITLEFVSILDESKAVNFTVDSCEGVLMVAKDQCEHGGKGITVSHVPVAASPTMKARDEGHNKLYRRGPMANIQGRDASVPLTAEVSIILQNSTTTTNKRAGTSETSLFFTSTAKCNDTIKMNTKVPESIKITTTLPITLTIWAAPHAGSTSTITTATTSDAISTTTKPTITTTTTTSTTITAMNFFFTAKIEMVPNDCGCAHC